MVTRVFSGWRGPMVDLVADWLLERREDLPGMCVVVPTSHSGRRLRQRLAERAGALLSPEFVTPAALLRTEEGETAPAWLETLAWCEALEGISDWSEMEGLFPQPPELETGALHPLADELRHLANRLQENGHTFSSAARMLSPTQDGGRWQCLAALENRFRKQLRAWGTSSRSDVLTRRGADALTHREYVLAGVPDMPPLVARWFRETGKPVTVLVAAPEEHATWFDDLGMPQAAWLDAPMPWPGKGRGNVRVVADARAQIDEAVRMVAESGAASDQVALGTGDAGLSAELARAFTAHGWQAFDPSASATTTGMRRWLRAWSAWLREESTARLADLLSLPGSDVFAPADERVVALDTLGQLRDRWMVQMAGDLKRTARGRTEKDEKNRQALLAMADAASQLRAGFRSHPFPEAIANLPGLADPDDPDAAFIREWIVSMKPIHAITSRPAAFWLDLLMTSLPALSPAPPDGRVIDVLGWLELPFESGSHLVVCGMNDGHVPSTIDGDPWLGASAGKLLGLPDNETRSARDAFLARQMFETRRENGRVDWILAKSGSGGESLRPSRILLSACGEELARRVRHLFREIPPAEAGVRWHADWQWQPRAVDHPPRISVTAFKDWIACPFRYYLKHVVRMAKPEPDRIEWNHRDFGNVFHAVVEAWANDEEARDFSKSKALAEWFSHCLDAIVAGRFGRSPSLAIRMQTEALRSRLEWLAHEQAVLRAEGWRPIAAERKFQLTIGGWTISGSIDRIDEHPESGLRVIDYKTSSSLGKVAGEHCSKVTSGTKLLEHWGEESPIRFEGFEKEKPVAMRWKNLQLPLYAVAVKESHGTLPQPCYIGVGAARNKVKVDPWTGFSQSDLDAAMECAGWIIGRIQQGVFWPPAEKASYREDDVASLACGRKPAEMFVPI